MNRFLKKARFVFLKKILPVLLISASGATMAFIPYWGGADLLPCRGSACQSICQLMSLGQNLIRLGITLAVFGFAPIFILWGGITLLTSGGSEQRAASGKKTLTAALVGMTIALCSFIIVNTFFWMVALSGGEKVDWSNIRCTQRNFPVSPGTYLPSQPPLSFLGGYQLVPDLLQ